MSKIKNLLNKNWLWALIVFAISFSVYLFTLAPTIFLEDSSEFVSAAATLGIPHPSGYPLYVLLGKLFTFLPIGDIVWQVNMMSAFFGALTCAMLFLVLQQIIGWLHAPAWSHNAKGSTQEGWSQHLIIFIPFITSLIFAFSLTFWSQAITAEVYCLNTFFVLLCVWILLKWSINKKDKLLLWFAFIFGLSLTNHTMMIMLAPVFIIYILFVQPNLIYNWKLILKAFILSILGFSIYLFLPLRSAMFPEIDWGRTRELKGFLYHLSRKQYGDFSWNILADFDLKNKWLFFDSFFKELLLQFTWVSVIFALCGFIWQWFKQKKVFFLLFGIFIMNSFAFILFRKTGFSIENEGYFRVYYLPAFLMFVIWFGLGLFYIINFLFKKINKNKKPLITQLLNYLIILILILLPLSFLINNYKYNDLSDFNFLNDYGYQVLNSLEPNAILIVYNEFPGLDNTIFSLTYWHAAKKMRQDVILVSLSGLFYQPTGSSMKDLMSWKISKQKQELVKYVWKFYSAGHPIYTFYNLNGTEQEDYLFTRSNGLVYKVYENIEQAKHAQINNPVLHLIDEENEKVINNNSGVDLLGDVFYARASYYLENNWFEKSQELFIKAFNFDFSPFSDNSHSYIKHREKWLGTGL